MLMRANTFEDQEPDASSWIASFEANDLFLDVGANVGSYSLYSAIRGNLMVAVEPDPFNLVLLNLNIYNNGLYDLVASYTIALLPERNVSASNLLRLDRGGDSKSFDEPVKFKGHVYKPNHKSGVYGLSLDDFLEN